MLQAFALLLLSQLSGEGITRGLGLPVPGPVIGLVLMAIGLLIAQRVDFVRTETIEETALGRTATGLLGHLSLLFVPAGVGIVQHGGTLLRNGVAIAVALVDLDGAGARRDRRRIPGSRPAGTRPETIT